MNLWMDSLTAPAFEGAFDAFFKVWQVQSTMLASRIFKIIVMIILGDTSINHTEDIGLTVTPPRVELYKLQLLLLLLLL